MAPELSGSIAKRICSFCTAPFYVNRGCFNFQKDYNYCSFCFERSKV